MPRKMRPAKARRATAANVSEALFLLLVWGDLDRACARAEADGSSPFELFAGHEHAAAWRAIEARGLAEWVEQYPGTRPASWWYWSAPELRRLHGGAYTVLDGVNRCHETGLPYVAILNWDWENNAPLVESQGAYLERLKFWLPGERARVPAGAFESERFSYDLTRASTGDETGGHDVR